MSKPDCFASAIQLPLDSQYFHSVVVRAALQVRKLDHEAARSHPDALCQLHSGFSGDSAQARPPCWPIALPTYPLPYRFLI